MNDDVWLQVSGPHLTTRAGRRVVLRGVGLGGLDEHGELHHRLSRPPRRCSGDALGRALGDEGYAAFFERFLDVFFADEDAAFLASLGLNSRAPSRELSPLRGRRRARSSSRRRASGCSTASSSAARGTVSTRSSTCTPCPAARTSAGTATTRRTGRSSGTHRHFQDRVVHLWEAIARPLSRTSRGWPATTPSTSRAMSAARRSAPSTGACTTPCARSIPTTSCSSTATATRSTSTCSASHGRTPSTPSTTTRCRDSYDGGDYPGVSRGQLRRPRRAGADVPALAPSTCGGPARRSGSASSVRCITGDAAPATRCALQLLADQLEIYGRHDASWALWTYKDIGLQGLVYAAPDSRLPAPDPPRARASKARLGDRRLGLVRRGRARHPRIRSRPPFAASSPASIPSRSASVRGSTGWSATCCWPSRWWRSSARCFEGLGPDAITALADSFRFGACVKRQALLGILRAATSSAID